MTQCAKTRAELYKDELSHLPEDKRDAALHLLLEDFGSLLECTVANFAADLAVRSEVEMEDFVHHAIVHYKQQENAHRTQVLFGLIDRQEADHIRTAAAATTGKDN